MLRGARSHTSAGPPRRVSFLSPHLLFAFASYRLWEDIDPFASPKAVQFRPQPQMVLLHGLSHLFKQILFSLRSKREHIHPSQPREWVKRWEAPNKTINYDKFLNVTPSSRAISMATPSLSLSIARLLLGSHSRLSPGQPGQAHGQLLFSLARQQRLAEVTRSQRVITFPPQG